MKRTLKKLGSLLLVLCMLLSVLPMTALAAEPPSGTDWSLDGTGLLTITSDDGMSDWLTSVDGDFTYSDHVTSVVVGDTVTAINNGAFQNRTNITSVTLGDSVTTIGDSAFYGCSSLKSVLFQGNTPPNMVGSNAFDITVTGIYVPAAALSAYTTALSGYASSIYAIPAAITKNSTTTYYPSLTAALEATADGDTITLLSDITESASNGKESTDITITIDGGGFTLTAPDSDKESIALSLIGTGTVILKDLTLKGGDSTGASVGLRVGGTLDIRSFGTVTVMGGAANYSYGLNNYSAGTVDVTAASATGTTMGVGVANNGPGTVNVSSAAGNGPQGIGVANSDAGTINVTTAIGSLCGVNNQNVGTVNGTSATGSLYGLYNVSSGTVNVTTITCESGEAVNNSSGTVNAKTITGTVTGTCNTTVAVAALNKETGASCVLDSITVAAAGETTVGVLPNVYKGSDYSNTWYTDSAKTTVFSDTTVTSATTLYSYYYEAPKIAAITNNSTTTYYQKLTDALTAALDGDTVTLLCDTTESVSYTVTADKTVTIDGQGYTVTGAVVSDSVALTLSGTGTVILKDLTLQGGASSGSSTGLDVSGSVSVQSFGTVTANGGAVMSSFGVTNQGTGTVDVTTASAPGGTLGYGAYNTGAGTINVGSVTGNGAMNSAGAYNTAGGTINVTTASGNRTGVKNFGSGTVNVTTATNTDANDPYGSAVENIGTGTVNVITVTGGTGVQNHSTGTVNVGTITGTTTNSGGGTVNTGTDATMSIPLHTGTGTRCVLDSITIAKNFSGTTQIGTLPDVYKDSACSAEWYTDVALTNLFTMQEISSEATLYSSYYEEDPINTAEIAGVTTPVTGAVPTSIIADTTQYTATISWSPAASTFAAGTVYTATITLTPKAGYTLSGVSANFFTVAGATVTNAADSGVVTAVFPATASSDNTGGGGSSSSESSSSSSTTNPTTTVSGSTATTTMTPIVSGGTATGSVTTSQMSDALDKAKAAAGTNGTPNVKIQIDGASGANSVGTTIPRSSMLALVSGGIGALTISGPTGLVSFGADALKTISGAASGDVTVTMVKTDSTQLSDAAKTLVGSHPVFTFSVTSGGSTISQFGGDVTVSVPYTPAAGEDTNAIVIYYIGANGELETVTNGHYDAATGRVIFTTTHFSSYAVGYNKVSFTDVSDTAWYSKAVTFLAARGVTSGTTVTIFSPDATLTRGQFITMLLRAYDVEAEANPTNNFSDAGDTYYTGYLAAAKKLGITSGIGNNRFAPDQAITRQEMFTMLYNALKVLDKLPEGVSGKTLSDFTDAGDVATWASEAMTALVKAGTVSGSSDKLSPTDTTTRSEMAQVLYSLLGK